MSDTIILKASNQEDFTGYKINRHNINLIKESLENDKSPLLPNDKGIINVVPIINLNTGYVLNGKEQLIAQTVRKNNGYESNYVGTKTILDKAKTTRSEEKENKDLGFSVNYKTSNGDFSSAKYYFAEDTLHPDRIEKYAKENTKQNFTLQSQTIKVETVGSFLPSYFAAVKLFQISAQLVTKKINLKILILNKATSATIAIEDSYQKEVFDEFKDMMIKTCTNELAKKENKNVDYEPLNKMLLEADIEANKIVKSLLQENSPKPKREFHRKEIERQH